MLLNHILNSTDEQKKKQEEQDQKNKANDKEEAPIILPRQQRVAQIEKILKKEITLEFPKMLTD